jgi:hypothetical protein
MSSYDSHLRAATAFALSGVDQQAVSGSAILMGLDINDDDSGNVHVHIHSGTNNTGTLVASADPAAGGHEVLWFGPNGIHCPNGIYVDVVLGTPSGSIYYR